MKGETAKQRRISARHVHGVKLLPMTEVGQAICVDTIRLDARSGKSRSPSIADDDFAESRFKRVSHPTSHGARLADDANLPAHIKKGVLQRCSRGGYDEALGHGAHTVSYGNDRGIEVNIKTDVPHGAMVDAGCAVWEWVSLGVRHLKRPLWRTCTKHLANGRPITGARPLRAGGATRSVALCEAARPPGPANGRASGALVSWPVRAICA